MPLDYQGEKKLDFPQPLLIILPIFSSHEWISDEIPLQQIPEDFPIRGVFFAHRYEIFQGLGLENRL